MEKNQFLLFSNPSKSIDLEGLWITMSCLPSSTKGICYYNSLKDEEIITDIYYGSLLFYSLSYNNEPLFSCAEEFMSSMTTGQIDKLIKEYQDLEEERNIPEMNKDTLPDLIVNGLSILTYPQFSIMGATEDISSAYGKPVIQLTNGQIMCWWAAREYSLNSDKYKHLVEGKMEKPKHKYTLKELCMRKRALEQ